MRLRQHESQRWLCAFAFATRKLTVTDTLTHTHTYTQIQKQNCINKRCFLFLFFLRISSLFFCTNEPCVRRHCLCWRTYVLHSAHFSLPQLSLSALLATPPPRHKQPFCSRLAFCLVFRSVAVVISVAAAAVQAFVVVAVSLRDSLCVCECVCVCLCCNSIVVVVLTAQLLAH